MGTDFVSVLNAFIVSSNENPLLKNMQEPGHYFFGDAPFCFMQNIIFQLADSLVGRALPEMQSASFADKYTTLRQQSCVRKVLAEAWRMMHAISQITSSPGYAWTMTPGKVLLCNNRFFVNVEKKTLDYLSFILCHIAQTEKFTFYDEQLLLNAWKLAKEGIVDLYDNIPPRPLDLTPRLTLHISDRINVSDLEIWTHHDYLYIKAPCVAKHNTALLKPSAMNFIFSHQGRQYCIPEEAVEHDRTAAKIPISQISDYAQ